jgi:hypothetical protein
MYAKDKQTVVDRREMLKVKLKALAAESQIIRRQERRTHGLLRDELAVHRRGVVRSEARHTHIAYGLIRGKQYEKIERPGADNPPTWDRVRKMISRYGPPIFVEPDVMRSEKK